MTLDDQLGKRERVAKADAAEYAATLMADFEAQARHGLRAGGSPDLGADASRPSTRSSLRPMSKSLRSAVNSASQKVCASALAPDGTDAAKTPPKNVALS